MSPTFSNLNVSGDHQRGSRDCYGDLQTLFEDCSGQLFAAKLDLDDDGVMDLHQELANLPFVVVPPVEHTLV